MSAGGPNGQELPQQNGAELDWQRERREIFFSLGNMVNKDDETERLHWEEYLNGVLQRQEAKKRKISVAANVEAQATASERRQDESNESPREEHSEEPGDYSQASTSTSPDTIETTPPGTSATTPEVPDVLPAHFPIFYEKDFPVGANVEISNPRPPFEPRRSVLRDRSGARLIDDSVRGLPHLSSNEARRQFEEKQKQGEGEGEAPESNGVQEASAGTSVKPEDHAEDVQDQEEDIQVNVEGESSAGSSSPPPEEEAPIQANEQAREEQGAGGEEPSRASDEPNVEREGSKKKTAEEEEAERREQAVKRFRLPWNSGPSVRPVQEEPEAQGEEGDGEEEEEEEEEEDAETTSVFSTNLSSVDPEEREGASNLQFLSQGETARGAPGQSGTDEVEAQEEEAENPPVKLSNPQPNKQEKEAAPCSSTEPIRPEESVAGTSSCPDEQEEAQEEEAAPSTTTEPLRLEESSETSAMPAQPEEQEARDHDAQETEEEAPSTAPGAALPPEDREQEEAPGTSMEPQQPEEESTGSSLCPDDQEAAEEAHSIDSTEVPPQEDQEEEAEPLRLEDNSEPSVMPAQPEELEAENQDEADHEEAGTPQTNSVEDYPDAQEAGAPAEDQDDQGPSTSSQPQPVKSSRKRKTENGARPSPTEDLEAQDQGQAGQEETFVLPMRDNQDEEEESSISTRLRRSRRVPQGSSRGSTPGPRKRSSRVVSEQDKDTRSLNEVKRRRQVVIEPITSRNKKNAGDVSGNGLDGQMVEELTKDLCVDDKYVEGLKREQLPYLVDFVEDIALRKKLSQLLGLPNDAEERKARRDEDEDEHFPSDYFLNELWNKMEERANDVKANVPRQKEFVYKAPSEGELGGFTVLIPYNPDTFRKSRPIIPKNPPNEDRYLVIAVCQALIEYHEAEMAKEMPDMEKFMEDYYVKPGMVEETPRGYAKLISRWRCDRVFEIKVRLRAAEQMNLARRMNEVEKELEEFKSTEKVGENMEVLLKLIG